MKDTEKIQKPCWDPAQYAEHARFVSDLGMPIVELLAPKPAEHILDLGRRKWVGSLFNLRIEELSDKPHSRGGLPLFSPFIPTIHH